MDNIELKSPIPVDILLANDLTTISAETVTFFKQDGTADAGEVAGTIVYGKLDLAPVMNLMGDRLGEYTGDAVSTSLVFTTDVMDSTKEISFIYNGSGNERLTRTVAALAAKSGNGWWALDYLSGLLVIKKANAGVSQAITSYKVRKLNLFTNSSSATGAPVTTEVTVTDVDTTVIAASNINRRAVWIQNSGANPVVLGPAGITFGTVGQLAAGAGVVLDGMGGALHGICGAGLSTTLKVFIY